MAEMIVPLPSLGDDAGDKASVSFVYVKPGDAVEEGADLVEMVTDKATFNVPCPAAGTVTKLLVSEGDEVSVGGPLCVLNLA